MERLHTIVEGQVQGVGCRDYTLRRAQRLGLRGWVKNRRDGKVEVVAEGARDQLDTLLGALRTGPPASYVRDVDVKWEIATGEYTEFIISW